MRKDAVGIIYSPGYGAGWSTWGKPEMALDQDLATLIDSGTDYSAILQLAEKNWPGSYMGGLEDCVVKWVEKGTRFRIDEYDGYESVLLEEDEIWQTA